MTKSARGTIDNPGTNVKAKSGLNRSLLEEGLGEFVRLLEYKLKLNPTLWVRDNKKSKKCL